MGWLVQSPLTMRMGELVGKRVAQIGRSSVERFDTFGGYMAGPDASSLCDYSKCSHLNLLTSFPPNGRMLRRFKCVQISFTFIQ